MIKRRPAKGPRLASLLIVMLVGVVLACKYSVRDVGFVDLSEDQYGLYLFLSDEASEGMPRDARTIATATFLESNLSLQVAHLGLEPEHASLWMAKAIGIDTFPAALLRSPDGQSLRIPLPSGSSTAVTDDDLWTLMEETVTSPKREWLLGQLLDAFSVIVLLESTDVEQNDAAHEAIEGAIDSIKELMPRMPKPVDTPPAVLTIPSAERSQEAIMLWSLGFDLDLTDEPQAAILIGRGRRLGPPLQGGLITRTKLKQMMALIGQDCECDLDRSWMQGPMVPLRWDSDQQQQAYKKLAFDPESPLVKAEISRILARGPNARGEASGQSSVSMDALFLGYSEELVDAVTGGSESKPEPTISPEETKTDVALDATEEAPSEPPAQDSKPELVESNESPKATPTEESGIPLTWITLLGLGVVALIGGAVVIVRGAGV